LLASLTFAACGTTSARELPAAQPRPLEALLDVAAYPNAETVVVLSTLQQLMASHREWQGYEFFGRLAREQPDRRVFFLGLQAVLQARVAREVPLLKRIAWVNDAIGKLDAAAAADPLLGRYARGSVFAELPERFGKTRVAVEDLEVCLSHRGEFPVNMDRAVYRALAVAYRTLGDASRSREMLAHSGFSSLDENVPVVLSDLSVDPRGGFRFSEKRLVREAEGVYVAEGYDFGNLSFIVGKDAIVAIDAGTTEPSAREAVAALRTVSQAPIKYVILTHGHWDHVGGLAAVREPGSTVIAQANFPEELARSRRYRLPFQDFFGTEAHSLDVTPDRLISAPETLRAAGIELELIPGKSGETNDALYVRDLSHDILFVGDAFMPYSGAPFVAEGSAEGYLGAIAQVLELHPRRLVHGHPMRRRPPARSPSSCTTISSRRRCARHPRRSCPISSRATRSCSGSTPSMRGTGKRTAKAWRTSRAPNGRSHSTSWAARARTRSGGPPIGWSSAVMPRWRSASPNWGSRGIPTASRSGAAARGRSPHWLRSTRR
jgi:glyoxylase-like metal-dependent hydrolase (beta-lactamase superfamily II)